MIEEEYCKLSLARHLAFLKGPDEVRVDQLSRLDVFSLCGLRQTGARALPKRAGLAERLLSVCEPQPRCLGSLQGVRKVKMPHYDMEILQ